MTAAIPTQVRRRKTKQKLGQYKPDLSSFLANEGKEEAVIPLWEVGGSQKACVQEPRPSANAPCSLLLSFKGTPIINYLKNKVFYSILCFSRIV